MLPHDLDIPLCPQGTGGYHVRHPVLCLNCEVESCLSCQRGCPRCGVFLWWDRTRRERCGESPLW